MAKYIAELAVDIFESYAREANSVEVKFGVTDIAMELDLAVPCGLIFNDSFPMRSKHGLPAGRQGAVRIGLNHGEGDELVRGVEDDGIGMPADFNLSKSKSLCLHLVDFLVNQIEGRLEMRGDGGTTFVISFGGS